MATNHNATQIQKAHDNLVNQMAAANRQKRWESLLRHPFHPFARRLGLASEPSPRDTWFQNCSLPKEVTATLEKCPADFITEWSLKADSAAYLYNLLKGGDFNTVVECGCGISTLIICLALGGTKARFISLEQDSFWLKRTREALEITNLAKNVELLHAPLTPISVGGMPSRAHEASGLDGAKIDFLFIDAPHQSIGRVGVLARMAPYLRPGGVILLDDASRQSELACVEKWIELGLADLESYLAKGNGLALLSKPE